ncbi:hypothetical protein CC80DRAFT_210278 [Byssothecium circinans]|uniref:Uncharacterized protein n=1 Tax=Byssothecium circinans TaxID=147558 RepID=A0A6A5TGV7_9PLEO|nr:hypothetical protein CC80DRAFT_210278 [Byssothecium circinans]
MSPYNLRSRARAGGDDNVAEGRGGELDTVGDDEHDAVDDASTYPCSFRFAHGLGRACDTDHASARSLSLGARVLYIHCIRYTIYGLHTRGDSKADIRAEYWMPSLGHTALARFTSCLMDVPSGRVKAHRKRMALYTTPAYNHGSAQGPTA